MYRFDVKRPGGSLFVLYMRFVLPINLPALDIGCGDPFNTASTYIKKNPADNKMVDTSSNSLVVDLIEALN